MWLSSKRIKNNAKEITDKLRCLREKIECLKEVENEELPKVSSGQADSDNHRFQEGVA